MNYTGPQKGNRVLHHRSRDVSSVRTEGIF